MPGMDIRRKKICVVDGDPSVLKAMKRLLEVWGWEVECFSSALGFLAAAPEADSLLLDIRMPEMSGFDLLEKMASRNMNFRVVLMTAYDDPRDEELSRSCGVAALLIKPISERTLYESLNPTSSPDLPPSQGSSPCVRISLDRGRWTWPGNGSPRSRSSPCSGRRKFFSINRPRSPRSAGSWAYPSRPTTAGVRSTAG